jgi:hypothetical protein
VEIILNFQDTNANHNGRLDLDQHPPVKCIMPPYIIDGYFGRSNHLMLQRGQGATAPILDARALRLGINVFVLSGLVVSRVTSFSIRSFQCSSAMLTTHAVSNLSQKEIPSEVPITLFSWTTFNASIVIDKTIRIDKVLYSPILRYRLFIFSLYRVLMARICY